MIFSKKTCKKQHKYSQIAYKMNSFDQEILAKFMEAEHSSDGVFGFELLKTPSNTESNVFSPSFLRLELPPSSLGSNKHSTQTVGYEIELENPSFLPLYTNSPINLFEFISNIEINHGSIFTQVLFNEHKMSNWREKLIDQYEHYLQGNHSPSFNSHIRNLQTKFLSVVDKITNFDNSSTHIQEVEDKILQANYRMEIRFLIDSDEEKQIVDKIRDLLFTMKFFNEFVLYKVEDAQKLEEDMYHRRFASFSKNLFYSKSEIKSLLSDTRLSILPVTNQKEAISGRETKSNVISNFLPVAKTIPREIDTSISKALEKTLQGLGITKSKLKIDSFEQGATLQKISVVIPKDTNYMKIEKQLKNIQANLGNESISMEIGDKPSTINFFVPCDSREVIYLSSLIQSEEYQEFMHDAVLPFVIGQDTVGNPLFADLQELVHILIAGTTGSGKSIFINNIITSLILAKTPQEMMMYLIDPKQVEFKVYNGIPHIKKVITDMNLAMNILLSLTKEMERRYTKFAEVGVRNLDAYNLKSNNPLPYIITIIDEFADLVGTHPQVENVIQRLGQKARAAGIHMIIATQRPSVDVITGVIKSNLPSTFCLRLKTSTDYKTVFGKGIPYTLLGNGDGVAAIEGHYKEFERFQSPVISLIDSEVEEMLNRMKQELGESTVDGIEIIEPESNLDKLKRIIAITNENRITHLRKEMKIRTEDVQGLMTELIEEGWMEKQGRSYVITATEEELNKWKD